VLWKRIQAATRFCLLQYSYARDVDYISAAFVMFPKDLYTNMGGLDPMYGEGYFEDTDLAITMASKGFKVMYQPLAVVSPEPSATTVPVQGW
jgi:GT2 family glycosyltransferase